MLLLCIISVFWLIQQLKGRLGDMLLCALFLFVVQWHSFEGVMNGCFLLTICLSCMARSCCYYGPVRWSETWLKLAEKHCSGWIVVREKHCSGWKNKPNKPNLRQANGANAGRKCSIWCSTFTLIFLVGSDIDTPGYVKGCCEPIVKTISLAKMLISRIKQLC